MVRRIALSAVFLMATAGSAFADEPSPTPTLPDSPPASVPRAVAPDLPTTQAEPVVPAYHVERETKTGLAVAGAVTFGVFYLPSCFLGAISGAIPNADLQLLFIPVFGPFAYVASNPDQGKQLFDGDAGIMVVNGLAQTAGAAMFIVGLWGREVVVREASSKVRVTPLLGATTGVAASADF